jgi:hypothetical protein
MKRSAADRARAVIANLEQCKLMARREAKRQGDGGDKITVLYYDGCSDGYQGAIDLIRSEFNLPVRR